MKKIILFAAILFAGVSVANAANPTDNVTLNVKLHGLQALTVNTGQKTVDLVYDEASKYLAGVSSVQEDHLIVSSTGGFIVTVESATDKLTSTGEGSETIESSTIKIKSEKGSNVLGGTPTYTEVNLTNSPTNLINSGVGGFDRNFNITYTGSGQDAYMANYINGEEPTTYTTTVTYTLVTN